MKILNLRITKYATFNIFLLLFILNQFSASNAFTCVTNPISISNISYCENNLCYFKQSTVGSVDIQSGQTVCYKYKNDIFTNDIYSVNITIGAPTISYNYNDCYYTDYIVGAGNCHCGCPFSGHNTDICPCNDAPPISSINTVCASNPVTAAGCFVGTLTNACCNINLSGFRRYQICSLSKTGTLNIPVVIETSNQQPCYFTLSASSQTFNCNNLNITFSNINTIPLTNKPVFRVIDSMFETTKYFYDNNFVNSINEFNYNKIGAYKIGVDGFITANSKLNSDIVLSSQNCADDLIIFDIPQLDITSTLNTRDINIPILKSGFIFLDTAYDMTYIGLTYFNSIAIGPNVEYMDINMTMVPYFNVTQSNGICSDKYRLFGNLTGINQNSECYFKVLRTSYAAGFQPKVVLLVCKHDTYLGTTVGGFQFSYCSGVTSVVGNNYPSFTATIPNISPATVLTLPLSTLSTRELPDTMYDLPIEGGNLLYNLEYDGVGLSVLSTDVSIEIIDINLSIDKLFVTIKTDQQNVSCSFQTNPFISDESVFYATNIPLVVESKLYNIDYKGDVTINVYCGKNTKSSKVNVNIQSVNGVQQNIFYPGTLSNKPFNLKDFLINNIYYTIGIGLVSLLSLFIIYKLFKIFCWKRKPKMIIHKKK